MNELLTRADNHRPQDIDIRTMLVLCCIYFFFTHGSFSSPCFAVLFRETAVIYRWIALIFPQILFMKFLNCENFSEKAEYFFSADRGAWVRAWAHPTLLITEAHWSWTRTRYKVNDIKTFMYFFTYNMLRFNFHKIARTHTVVLHFYEILIHYMNNKTFLSFIQTIAKNNTFTFAENTTYRNDILKSFGSLHSPIFFVRIRATSHNIRCS